jgi:hypothetical protein
MLLTKSIKALISAERLCKPKFDKQKHIASLRISLLSNFCRVLGSSSGGGKQSV